MCNLTLVKPWFITLFSNGGIKRILHIFNFINRANKIDTSYRIKGAGGELCFQMIISLTLWNFWWTSIDFRKKLATNLLLLPIKYWHHHWRIIVLVHRWCRNNHKVMAKISIYSAIKIIQYESSGVWRVALPPWIKSNHSLFLSVQAFWQIEVQ